MTSGLTYSVRANFESSIRPGGSELAEPGMLKNIVVHVVVSALLLALFNLVVSSVLYPKRGNKSR
jgi:hypothetical protein